MIREVEVLDGNPFSKTIEYVVNDEVVGYLKYLLIYDRMEIDCLFVDEKKRQMGIANKLMAYLISVAINNHVVNITLEVRISNEIARYLYRKYGFREVALRKFYYGDEDGILMEKQVMQNERYLLLSY